MMDMFGEPVNDDEFHFGYEELGFDEYPRDVQWKKRPSEEKLAAFKVVVIGGGISGIAAAIQLKRMGIPFTVIERQPDVGGTWPLNSYPAARVDTSRYPSHFKYERNYPWSEF